RYPSVRDRCHVISQCFDSAKYPRTNHRRRSGIDPLTLRYLGDFYGRRSPRPLLEAILALESRDPERAGRWRFEVVGRFASEDQGDCAKLLEKSTSVSLREPVEYERSLELMVDSDVLLVIDAPAQVSPFLPSKLVEYIGADRPIVALTPPGAASKL